MSVANYPKNVFIHQIELTLNADSTISDVKDTGGLDITGEHTWTMIYDEGFEVSLGPTKLFFFNYYEKCKFIDSFINFNI